MQVDTPVKHFDQCWKFLFEDIGDRIACGRNLKAFANAIYSHLVSFNWVFMSTAIFHSLRYNGDI